MELRFVVMSAAAMILITAPSYAQDSSKTDRPDSETVQKLDQMAEDALSRLRDQNATARAEWDRAYGYAVFDATKGGLLVTAVGGTGVAQPKSSGPEVVMHIGGGGIALGAGLEVYKLVLLIADEATYTDFVRGEWQGGVAAQAAAGRAGAGAEEQFVNGIAAYQIDTRGLMAQADVTALRFWPIEG